MYILLFTADYVAAEMERIGLVPLGDMERTSFFNIVPGSISEQFCPRGMMNVIGMIPGADLTLNEEYVIFSAHFDGPNNENPQTQVTRGNQDTTNTFDDALAVAFGLGLAEEMILQSPPKRNVIFLFDDVEEGWANVLSPDDIEFITADITADMTEYWCSSSIGKPYYESVMYRQGFEGYQDDILSCLNWPVGFTSWLRDPTVDDINKVKLIFNIDPLGIPPGVSADDLVLAVLNGETSTSVDNDGSPISLNRIIDKALPGPPVSYLKSPLSIISGFYNSADALRSPTTYNPLCEAGNICRDDGGIPNVSQVSSAFFVTFRPYRLKLLLTLSSQVGLAAMSFQKYHGGGSISLVKDLFSQLSALGLYQDKFLPDTAYFSLDNVNSGNFEAEDLNALTTSLSELIGNLFDREELSNLTFNKDNPPDDEYRFNAEDRANLINAMEMLSVRVDAIAPDVEFYKQAQAQLISQLYQLEGVPPETPNFQESIKKLAMVAVGLHLSLDTFNKKYARKEAFLDQTVAGVGGAEATDESAKVNEAASDEAEGVEGEDEVAPSEGVVAQENEVTSYEGEDNAGSNSPPTPPTTSSASDAASIAAAAHAHVGLLGPLGSVVALFAAALASFSML